MSKILLINSVTENEHQTLNDVVAVLEDSQNPTPKELEKFTVIEFYGETGDETRAKMNFVMPMKKSMWKERDSEIWKELNNDIKFKLKYENGKFINNIISKPENLSIVNESHIKTSVVSTEKLRIKSNG